MPTAERSRWPNAKVSHTPKSITRMTGHSGYEVLSRSYQKQAEVLVKLDIGRPTMSRSASHSKQYIIHCRRCGKGLLQKNNVASRTTRCTHLRPGSIVYIPSSDENLCDYVVSS